MQAEGKEWALVTGASQGIGFELAQCFARDGINLVLVARSGDRLQQLAEQWKQQYKIQVVPLVADLAEAEAPSSVCEQLTEANITITYLVNNAGVGLFGKYQDTDLEREHSMIMLNCVALAQLTKRLLPDMLKQGKGRILNVASTASFQPGPRQAVYFATKAFVLSFSEAIAEDLRRTGVSVTALCPGLTESGFIDAADMAHSSFARLTPQAKAQQVAATGYAAMHRQKRVVIPGFLNWISAQLPRFTPRWLVTRVVAGIMG